MGFWLASVPAHAQFSYFPALYNGPVGLCRLGINGALRSYPIEPLRLGWYVDYVGTSADVPGISYFPVIRLEETSTGYNYSYRAGRVPATEVQLRALVASKPGHYWIIGNEPDRIQFQDDITPAVYARAYHELYTIIKDQDPTAKIVAGTIVQPTPVRLMYLDLVLESYYNAYKEAMPVDAWAFHNFILNEASCEYYRDKVPPQDLGQICWGADIPPGVDETDGLRIDVQLNDDVRLFKEQVRRFRQWMADRGYRDTPAFLSEFGILMPQNRFNPDFTSERVNAFMNETFTYLMTERDPNIGYSGDDNRLVQRFAWYSIDDNFDHNGFIFDPNLPVESSRTSMGDNYVNFANNMAESVDFYVDEVRLLGAPPLTSAGATTVTLEAKIGNSGNLASTTQATVRFFNGNPNSGGTLIGEAQTVHLPGCGEQATVQIEWGAVSPGDYTVYVQVESNVAELSALNNNGTLAVSFTDANLYLPSLDRELLLPE
jgi:hypothetical protein